MSTLFKEFENENALRSYPFASGCQTRDKKGVQIGTGVIIDAALYPINPTGNLYLSGISADGVVSISDSNTVVMTAEAGLTSSVLEFYDTSSFRRHVGTIIASSPEALASLVNIYTDRQFEASETTFASSCVFPIVNDGVISVNVGSQGELDASVKFKNGAKDEVRVSTNLEGNKLRFDALPRPESVGLTSIQHIYCIVDGKTPFRILKLPFGGAESGLGNTVAVYLDNIDKHDICANTNREDSLEMKDTCDCDDCKPIPSPTPIPDVYQVEVVDIPNHADSAFYLAVPNMTGYDNPLSLTMSDGVILPSLDVEVSADADNTKVLTDSLTAKGVILQVPGLAPTT